MRRLFGLAIVLSTLACQRGEPPRPPVDPTAELDALIARIDGVADDPWPGACDELDAALGSLANSEVGQLATYARAEAALRCDRTDRWQALHEQLARADYLPSLMRLANDAVEHHDWDRALVIVERIAERSEMPGERERMQQIAARIIHARWVERGDPDDFAWLERAAKIEVVRDPKRLEPRAALIRLYVEQVAITGDRETLLLAQTTEREARRVADELRLRSPALELASGFVRELEGDRVAAVAAWTRALELNAALVEPHLWLGLAALQRHDVAAARTHLLAFVSVHPDHVEAQLALGEAARRADDLEHARRIHADVIALSPGDPRPYWYLALAHDPWRPNLSMADVEDAMIRQQLALGLFVAVHDRVGPRECPPRGQAGPDLGCVRQAEALAQTRELAADLAEALRADLHESPPSCQAGWSEAKELEARERERRERLLELERQARELE